MSTWRIKGRRLKVLHYGDYVEKLSFIMTQDGYDNAKYQLVSYLFVSIGMSYISFGSKNRKQTIK
jgi:hypothetical protein